MSISISDITRKYESIGHTWINSNSFISSEALVKTMPDPEDSTNNSASTEWVNQFFNNKNIDSGYSAINIPLMTPMWFDHLLSSSSWVMSDFERNDKNNYGWLSGAIYSKIYTHLVMDISSSNVSNERINNRVVTYRLASDGHKILLYSGNTGDDDVVFNETGVAWYYVLDTTNGRFKLPRNRYGFQGLKYNSSTGTANDVGAYDKPGIPSINGTVTFSSGIINGATGCFSGNTNAVAPSTSSSSKSSILTLKTSSPYGDSDTVQPPSVEMYLYFSTGDESSGSGSYSDTTGSCGYVIDGSRYILNEEGDSSKEIESKTYDTITSIYTVQNDCCLYVQVTGPETTAETTWTADFYVGTEESPIHASDGVYVASSHANSFSVNIKKGSIIYVYSSKSISVKFIEYRLISLDAQIAMPEWDSSNIQTIPVYPATYTAPDNGFIYVREDFHQGGTPVITINRVQINKGSTYQYGSGPLLIPVMKGDIFTWSHCYGQYFIPCKTIQQSSPSVYVIKRIHGNDATTFSTSVTYSVNDFVKKSSGNTMTYYRVTEEGKGNSAKLTQINIEDVPSWCYTVYSDGWCEQSGTSFFNSFDATNGNKIEFKQRFSNKAFNVFLSMSTNKSDAVYTVNEYKWKRAVNSIYVYANGDSNITEHLHYVNWKAEGFIN